MWSLVFKVARTPLSPTSTENPGSLSLLRKRASLEKGKGKTPLMSFEWDGDDLLLDPAVLQPCFPAGRGCAPVLRWVSNEMAHGQVPPMGVCSHFSKCQLPPEAGTATENLHGPSHPWRARQCWFDFYCHSSWAPSCGMGLCSPGPMSRIFRRVSSILDLIACDDRLLLLFYRHPFLD